MCIRDSLVPPLYLGSFYTGLGASLMGAGAGFLYRFCRAVRRAEEEPPCQEPDQEL